MLRLRQKELLWIGLESQEERLRWLDSELNLLKLSKELRSVPVVQELADEGEGLGPRWRDIALERQIIKNGSNLNSELPSCIFQHQWCFLFC